MPLREEVDSSSSLIWIPLYPPLEGCDSDINSRAISKIALDHQTGSIFAQDSVHSAVYKAVKVCDLGKLGVNFQTLEASHPQKKLIATQSAIITAEDVQPDFTTEPIPGTDELMLRPKVWQLWLEQ